MGESGNQSIQAQGPTHPPYDRLLRQVAGGIRWKSINPSTGSDTCFPTYLRRQAQEKTNGRRRKQTTAQADSLAGSRNFLLAHPIRSSSHDRCRQFTIMKCRSHLALAKLPHRRPRNSERTGSSNLSFYLDMRRYALFLLTCIEI